MVISTDGKGQIDSAIDPDQEYIHTYIIWSETLLFNETSTFTLRVTGITNNEITHFWKCEGKIGFVKYFIYDKIILINNFH